VYQPLKMCMGHWRRDEFKENTKYATKKLGPLSLCAPQISYGPWWDWTSASMVRNQLLPVPSQSQCLITSECITVITKASYQILISIYHGQILAGSLEYPFHLLSSLSIQSWIIYWQTKKLRYEEQEKKSRKLNGFIWIGQNTKRNKMT